MRKHWLRAGLLALLAAVPLTAAAQGSDYVVTASAWGPDQAAAVAAAGGTVVFGHDGAGVAVVRSSAPDFAGRLRASAAIQSVEADRVVDWQQPTEQQSVEENNQTRKRHVLPRSNGRPRRLRRRRRGPSAAPARACALRSLTAGCLRPIRISRPTSTSRLRDLLCPARRSTPTSAPSGTARTSPASSAPSTTPAALSAFAPEATLVGVKVLQNGSGSFGWVIQGILYAATPIAQGGAGADIINMSLGALFPKNDPDAHGLVAAMNRAVNFADRFGVLVVSAAGNDGVDLDHSGNTETRNALFERPRVFCVSVIPCSVNDVISNRVARSSQSTAGGSSGGPPPLSPPVA